MIDSTDVRSFQSDTKPNWKLDNLSSEIGFIKPDPSIELESGSPDPLYDSTVVRRSFGSGPNTDSWTILFDVLLLIMLIAAMQSYNFIGGRAVSP